MSVWLWKSSSAGTVLCWVLGQVSLASFHWIFVFLSVLLFPSQTGKLRLLSLSLWLSDSLLQLPKTGLHHRKSSLVLLSKFMHELQQIYISAPVDTTRSVKAMPYTYGLDTYDRILLQWFCDFIHCQVIFSL